LGDKINASDKAKVDEAVADLRKALESGDIQAIKDKTEALKQASYKIAEEIYKTQAQGAQQSGQQGPDFQAGGGGDTNTGGSGHGGDNTKAAEDADYEVVDDDK